MIASHHARPTSLGNEGGVPTGPGVEEHTLHSERLQIERKTFTLSLRENPRGQFLRITEDVAGRHDTIIVPAPGLTEFLRVLGEIAGKMSPQAAAGAASSEVTAVHD